MRSLEELEALAKPKSKPQLKAAWHNFPSTGTRCEECYKGRHAYCTARLTCGCDCRLTKALKNGAVLKEGDFD